MKKKFYLFLIFFKGDNNLIRYHLVDSDDFDSYYLSILENLEFDEDFTYFEINSEIIDYLRGINYD